MVMLITVNIIIGFSFLLVYPSYLADFRFEGPLLWSAILIATSSAWSFGVFSWMIERRYRVLLRRVYLYRVVMIGVPFLHTYAGMMLFALFISSYLFFAAITSLILVIILSELFLRHRKIKKFFMKSLSYIRKICVALFAYPAITQSEKNNIQSDSEAANSVSSKH